MATLKITKKTKKKVRKSQTKAKKDSKGNLHCPKCGSYVSK